MNGKSPDPFVKSLLDSLSDFMNKNDDISKELYSVVDKVVQGQDAETIDRIHYLIVDLQDRYFNIGFWQAIALMKSGFPIEPTCSS